MATKEEFTSESAEVADKREKAEAKVEAKEAKAEAKAAETAPGSMPVIGADPQNESKDDEEESVGEKEKAERIEADDREREADRLKGSQPRASGPQEDDGKKKKSSKSGKMTAEAQLPILREGYWVRLGGKGVPDAKQGHIAEIVRAPISVNDGTEKGALSPRPHEVQAEDAVFLVLTRDASREYLELTRDSFMEISTNGRAALVAHG